jgi:predicted small lipoprotein YifL
MSTEQIKTRRSPGTLLRIALLGLCLALFGAACGQRGPLYLPRPDTPAEGAEPSSAGATEDSGGQAGNEDAAGDEVSDEKTP